MSGIAFGPYRLEHMLGRGGMGEVWRAYDTDSHRTVALKLLPAHLAEDQSFQERFRREARTAAALTEPHVVPIHRFGEIDGRLYVDMRLIEGADLGSIVDGGPVAPGRAVTIVEQVASALNAAHRAGLVHRDVKPTNVLVTEDDFAYLIDFGIARSTTDTGMTGTGQVVGTWAYMAPERFNSRNLDARSDVYSLACVLHECLTGRKPFAGNSIEEQIGAHLSSPPPRPSVMARNIPARFDDVIARGMAKQPAERYGTTVELARAARGVLAGPPTPTTPPPYPRRAPAYPPQRPAWQPPPLSQPVATTPIPHAHTPAPQAATPRPVTPQPPPPARPAPPPAAQPTTPRPQPAPETGSSRQPPSARPLGRTLAVQLGLAFIAIAAAAALCIVVYLLAN